jgi:hypothetical protein
MLNQQLHYPHRGSPSSLIDCYPFQKTVEMLVGVMGKSGHLTRIRCERASTGIQCISMASQVRRQQRVQTGEVLQRLLLICSDLATRRSLVDSNFQCLVGPAVSWFGGSAGQGPLSRRGREGS